MKNSHWVKSTRNLTLESWSLVVRTNNLLRIMSTIQMIKNYEQALYQYQRGAGWVDSSWFLKIDYAIQPHNYTICLVLPMTISSIWTQWRHFIIVCWLTWIKRSMANTYIYYRHVAYARVEMNKVKIREETKSKLNNEAPRIF